MRRTRERKRKKGQRERERARKNLQEREQPRWQPQSFVAFTEVTSDYFCHVPFIRKMSLHPAHIQRERITQKHRYRRQGHWELTEKAAYHTHRTEVGFVLLFGPESAILHLDSPAHKSCIIIPQDAFQLEPVVLGGLEKNQKARFKATFNFTTAL